MTGHHFDGFVSDCGNSIANALELLQSCTKPSICHLLLSHPPSFVADYEEDEWPDFPGEVKSRLGIYNGNALEATGFGRILNRRSDSVFYNMAVVLAAVAAGFDIRLANTTAVHPRCMGPGDEDATSLTRRDSGSISSTGSAYIGQRRDAYFSAVRDSFIEPGESSYQDYTFTATTGYPHNTYHGIQTRYRPTINFDVPIRFTEATDSHGQHHDSQTTPSGSISPRKLSRSSDNDYDMALISLSPSQDKQFVQYQRQMSDTSSSVFETPTSTPKTTPHHYNVKFEDSLKQSPSSYSHRRSPSNTSSTSIPSHTSHEYAKYDYDSTLIRPPPRHPNSTESHQGTPERPVTLDIIPRPRPQPSLLRKASPQHIANSRSSPRSRVTPTPSDTTSIGGRSRVTPTPSDSGVGLRSRFTPTPSDCSIGYGRSRVTPTPSDSLSAGGDDASFVSAQSRPSGSPGSTPPHIEHQKTLLDIDMDGQSSDSTQPLPLRRHAPPPTITELEREFLS